MQISQWEQQNGGGRGGKNPKRKLGERHDSCLQNIIYVFLCILFVSIGLGQLAALSILLLGVWEDICPLVMFKMVRGTERSLGHSVKFPLPPPGVQSLLPSVQMSVALLLCGLYRLRILRFGHVTLASRAGHFRHFWIFSIIKNASISFLSN